MGRKIGEYILIILPKSYNYIGCFLTLRCNFNCSYCINNYSGAGAKFVPELAAVFWAMNLPKIKTTSELPITIQGGEPTGIYDFHWLMNALKNSGMWLDLLTNGDFNIGTFCQKIGPKVFFRQAKYASIRFSFHPGQVKIRNLVMDVKWMQDKGYSVGIWGLDHPAFKEVNARAITLCHNLGIDFRMKEFLGMYKGKLYGKYLYPRAVSKIKHEVVFCKPSELLINPYGYIFRCHGDLYAQNKPIGSLHDDKYKPLIKYTKCTNFGFCNPCDVKIKFNRYQETGHCSVSIKKEWQ